MNYDNFEEYLLHLEETGLSAQMVENIRNTWNTLFLLFGVNRNPPCAGPTEDGFLMEWRTDTQTFSIEILNNGTIDWFYRDRTNNVLAGSDSLEGDCPEIPIDMLKDIRKMVRKKVKNTTPEWVQRQLDIAENTVSQWSEEKQKGFKVKSDETKEAREYWKFLEENSKVISEWPKWKKGK